MVVLLTHGRGKGNWKSFSTQMMTRKLVFESSLPKLGGSLKNSSLVHTAEEKKIGRFESCSHTPKTRKLEDSSLVHTKTKTRKLENSSLVHTQTKRKINKWKIDTLPLANMQHIHWYHVSKTPKQIISDI